MDLRRAFAAAWLAALLAGAAAWAEPIPDDAIPAVLAALEGESGLDARRALERIEAARDMRFVAVLVELVRAAEIGVASPEAGRRSQGALEALTGMGFGSDWRRWVGWYAGTALEPPPGFTGFKGRLLGRIDPAFAELLRDDRPRRIRSEEIVWGGVAYEGIPALDRPAVVAAPDAGWLGDGEPVFGIVLGGEARAYPLRILDWHEMVNDEVGGVAFSLAYCTLCGSGIAFATEVPGHGALDFGSSGLLMRSNKLMVDRRTRTLWNQLTGRPVLGPLADEEIALEVLPSVVTRWGDWRARHPDTTVLSLETGHARPYRPGAAYAGYFASDDTMFPVRTVRDELAPKARVFAIARGDAEVAWPLDALLARGVVNDRVGALPVVVVATQGEILVDGDSVRSGPARYAAGAAVRAYARGDLELAPAPEPDVLVDREGRHWRVAEDALVGPDGARRPRVAGVLSYWFGWSAYHPETRLRTGGRPPGSRANGEEEPK